MKWPKWLVAYRYYLPTLLKTNVNFFDPLLNTDDNIVGIKEWNKTKYCQYGESEVFLK